MDSIWTWVRAVFKFFIPKKTDKRPNLTLKAGDNSFLAGRDIRDNTFGQTNPGPKKNRAKDKQ
jgi:hypothetical protein